MEHEKLSVIFFFCTGRNYESRSGNNGVVIPYVKVHAVAQSAEALYCRPEGRVFDFRFRRWDFVSLT